MSAAVMAATCRIPLKAISRIKLAQLRKKTEVKYLPLGENEALLIEGSFTEAGYLHLPRQFGADVAKSLDLDIEDQTSAGYEATFAPTFPPRDYQGETLAELLEASQQYYDVVFRAHTGWGKTYGALWVAAQRGRTTLILVDQDNLQGQWTETLMELFGFARNEIGIVRGDTCNWDGYAVVISTVQTLSQRQYEPEFYEYFGTVILDEAHIMGAPVFSSVLYQFPAEFRLAVSATPKRKDALQKLLTQHLGPIRVAADKEHDANAVYFVRNYNTYSWYANTSRKLGRLISEVSEDGSRNLQLAEITQWLRSTGRDVLVLSDRTEHMRHMQNLCYYMGMDDDEMGQYTGITNTLEYRKDESPVRRPYDLWPSEFRDEDGKLLPTPYTPISLQSVARKIPSKVLAATKETAQTLWATYGKAAKGFDEPRLCGGVDATPRSAAEQIHGRILRGKAAKAPIWVTTLDWNNPRLLKGFLKRIEDFLKSNGEIYEWLDEGGLKPWEPADLFDHVEEQLRKIESCRIETGPDGRYTLLTPKERLISGLRTGSGIRPSTLPNSVYPVVSSRRVLAARPRPQESAPATSKPLRLRRRRAP